MHKLVLIETMKKAFKVEVFLEEMSKKLSRKPILGIDDQGISSVYYDC